jgi:hypothetical protein
MPIVHPSKNRQVQAICFDFDVLTRSVDKSEKEAAKEKSSRGAGRDTNIGIGTPNASVVQEIATVLKVELQTARQEVKRLPTEARKMTCHRLVSHPKRRGRNTYNTIKMSKVSLSRTFAPNGKLSKKIEGGMAGVALAKHETETNKGDAAGHMAYRKSPPPNQLRDDGWPSDRNWAFIAVLDPEVDEIALLPRPEEIDGEEGERMEDMKKQLFDVGFDLCKMVHWVPKHQQSLESLQLDPTNVLLVSTEYDYLRAAKDCGMVTVGI